MSSKNLHPRSELFRSALTSLVLFIGATLSVASSAPPSPNILFVLADDLGYMDINAYATRVTGTLAQRQFYATPNLGRLAHSGTAFSLACACHLCSPTRGQPAHGSQRRQDRCNHRHARLGENLMTRDDRN